MASFTLALTVLKTARVFKKHGSIRTFIRVTLMIAMSVYVYIIPKARGPPLLIVAQAEQHRLMTVIQRISTSLRLNI